MHNDDEAPGRIPDELLRRRLERIAEAVADTLEPMGAAAVHLLVVMGDRCCGVYCGAELQQPAVVESFRKAADALEATISKRTAGNN